jgi:hypothetical protein
MSPARSSQLCRKWCDLGCTLPNSTPA